MITNKAVNEAIDFILLHINEDLTVDDIAAHCHFSKYYFSRLFRSETGESIYSFIKRLRVEQGAFRLKVEPARTITDIGGEFGYSSSNFSSVFRQHFQESPLDFRRKSYQNTVGHPFFHQMGSGEVGSSEIRIQMLPDYFVLFERRFGSYRGMSQVWCDFLHRYEGYITDETVFLERTYDDPSITDTQNCLYDICMSVHEDCDLDNTYLLQGGKCAVYPFRGLGKHIYAAYQMLLTEWFPSSGYELDERCGFDIYHRVDFDTMYMELDICLPVR